MQRPGGFPEIKQFTGWRLQGKRGFGEKNEQMDVEDSSLCVLHGIQTLSKGIGYHAHVL